MSRLLSPIIMIALFGVSSNAQKISLSVRNVPIQRVFDSIQRQTGVNFGYEPKLLNAARPVSVEVSGKSLEELLPIVFKNQPFTYKISIEAGLTAVYINAFNHSGTIRDESGTPLYNVTVTIKGSTRGTTSGADGKYQFNLLGTEETLVFSYVGYEGVTVKLNKDTALLVTLQKKPPILDEVIFDNGHEQMARKRATGSFITLGKDGLWKQRPQTGFYDRINGNVGGFSLFTNRVNNNQPQFLIRGINSIAFQEPLIVLDGIPFQGNLNDIDLNSIASITVAKDAVANAQWGARAGNGVIILTSTKAKQDSLLHILCTSNLTLGEKQNIFYYSILNPTERIKFEIDQFNKGQYDYVLSTMPAAARSPVVDILDKRRNNLITESMSQSMINNFVGKDVRNDIKDFFHRNSLTFQNALQAGFGSEKASYLYFVGYSKTSSELIRNSSTRFTGRGTTTRLFFDKKLKLFISLSYSQTDTKSNTPPVDVRYFYEDLVDNGKVLALTRDLNLSFIDTFGRGNLLGWQYRPLDELRLADNTNLQSWLRGTISLKYNILKGLDVQLLYGYDKGQNEGRNNNNSESYFVRDFINKFSQVDPATGKFIHPIPYGNILDISRYENTANNYRVQATYSLENGEHSVNLLAGAEIRILRSYATSYRLFGYNEKTDTGKVFGDSIRLPLLLTPYQYAYVDNNYKNLNTLDYYRSLYLNASYMFGLKYILSASIRNDWSNLVGAGSNKKGAPFYSIGALADINRIFFDVPWLTNLRLRVTYGVTGNVDNKVIAHTTVMKGEERNPFGEPQAAIIYPPNKELSWEKIHQTNFGIDFGFLKDHITGSIEYYLKNSYNLIADKPIAPSTGVTRTRANSASIQNKGIELSINALLMSNSHFKWENNLLLSTNIGKITHYEQETLYNNYFVNDPVKYHRQNYPVYPLVSYPSPGLDKEGNPLGFYNGQPTTDYYSILYSTSDTNVILNGSTQPTVLSSLQNAIQWKGIELSILLLMKTGNKFFRNSINYSALMNGAPGHNDYLKRWQYPGDENKTSIPGIPTFIDYARDEFYTHSSQLIEDGSHIRLQEIQLNYVKRFGKVNIKLYTIVTNVGIIWKATKTSYDPDYAIETLPKPRTYTLGVNFNF